MHVEDSRSKTIYRNEYDGKTYYKIGISHKKQDGTYENGYMACRFPKAADIPDKTRIMILEAWIDFYLTENPNSQSGSKKTNPYIFINKYEINQEYPTNQTGNEATQNDIPMNAKTEYDGIALSDEDLPF